MTTTLVLRPAEREVLLDGAPIELTRREFDLLAVLMSSPRRVFSRRELLERAWPQKRIGIATVTEHVHRLRALIESDPAQPRRIHTVRGVGYYFTA